ncbi:XRE family transcriptional regulator [Niallia circulans]|nr:XRE family transcriptional regulator [Niallia circulans]
MTLGQRLKIARIKNNLKQIEAAKILGVSSNVLSTYERDFRDPDTATLKKIAETYSVSSDYLLGIESNDDQPKHPLEKVFEEISNEINLEDISFLTEEEKQDEVKKLLKTILINGVYLTKRLKDDL